MNLSNEDIKNDYYKIDEKTWSGKAKDIKKFIFENSHTTVDEIEELRENENAFKLLKLSFIHNLVHLAEEENFSFASVMDIECFIHILWDLLVERQYILDNESFSFIHIYGVGNSRSNVTDGMRCIH